VLFWVGFKSAHSSWLMQERTSIGLPFVFPVMKSTIPAAAALLFTQGVSEFIRAVRSLGKGGDA
jgi:TRAP-type mannitol/chloroaromatic compound transport system permease small subunit